MNPVPERLAAFRNAMAQGGLDALYISGTDPHRSEYLCSHWQTRRFATGFTGSYGEVVITRDSCWLWTDSRYFLQAEEELLGTGIQILKLRIPGAIPVSAWLPEHLPPGSKIGADYFSLPAETLRKFREMAVLYGFNMVNAPGIVDEVWLNRPPLPQHPAYEQGIDLAGESRLSKLNRIREKMMKRGAGFVVITALDDLAWTLNLRGSDVPYSPLFMGFAIVETSRTRLYVCRDAIPPLLKATLRRDGVFLEEYDTFYSCLSAIAGERICLDPASVNAAIWTTLREKNTLLEDVSIPAEMKSVKNRVELEGFRKSALKDGAVMVQFLEWLALCAGDPLITEYSVAAKLNELRAQQSGYVAESFAPLVSVREHGAMVHLSVDAHNALPIGDSGVLLIDTGGHYATGTTDVTRTVALGRVTKSQRHDFTLVLKGLIALSSVKFPAGTKGNQLDILARQALWQNGLNYGHGTSHGVGHFLNVHEGPVSIRQEYNPCEIMPGMVLTNEPGIYRKGEYGIRLENMMVCVFKETTEFGTFLGFDTLTLCPVDLSLVEKQLLTTAEKEWLNLYHQKVRRELLPLLGSSAADFLKSITPDIL